MRISDWSSDVCSSDLPCARPMDPTPNPSPEGEGLIVTSATELSLYQMVQQQRRFRLFDALAWIALASLILVTAAHLVTKPPAMPAYADVRAAWKPSEAWLYDRAGRLLATISVDFQRRRPARVPLKNISPAVRDELGRAPV